MSCRRLIYSKNLSEFFSKKILIIPSYRRWFLALSSPISKLKKIDLFENDEEEIYL